MLALTLAFLVTAGSPAVEAQPENADAGGPVGEAEAAPVVERAPPVNWDRVVRWDAGRDEETRDYRGASPCSEKPCVVTEDGAIRFAIDEPDRFEISMRLLHRGQITLVDYLEKRSLRDYLVVERMFNRRRNKNVWSMMERLQSGAIDTFYVYGLKLQYAIDDGDLLIVDVVERERPSERRTFFFRYHRLGVDVRMDVALLIPIAATAYPKPDPPYKVSSLNAAASIALRFRRDPEADYWFIQKVLFTVSPTLFLGLLTRRLQQPLVVPKTQFDLFTGVGLTAFDFIFVAWGVNVFQKPRTTGLFAGVHVGKAIGFLRDLDRSSPQKWDDYLERERSRRIVESDDGGSN